MKLYGEAAVLELILNSNVLPEIVKAYSEPLAAAYGKIGSITMYGEGNTANLAKEITNNGTQVIDSLEKTLGIDLKSVLAGVLGTKLVEGIKTPKEKPEEK
jgi:flotillin